MIFESRSPVEFQRGVAVIDLEVNNGCSEFSGLTRKEIEGLRADAPASATAAHKDFIDPRASATVFEAVVKGHDDVPDGLPVVSDQPNPAQGRIAQQPVGYVRGYRLRRMEPTRGRLPAIPSSLPGVPANSREEPYEM
jgi:hypothetical protein